MSEKSDYTLAVTVKNAATQRSFGWSFDSYSPVMDDKPDLAVIGERLKANGSYAFMVGPYDHPWPTRTYAVYRRDRRGRKQLDIGEDIEPDSFHATTTTLSWVRAGPSRTASFR